LRFLDEVLKNQQAVAALRKGLPLGIALEISKGDDLVLRESLVAAKQNLQKARGVVLTGYTGSLDLLQTIKDIVGLANSLHEEMAGYGQLDKRKARS